MKHDCYINVEYCTSVATTKYIRKQIHKVTFSKIENTKIINDEIFDEISSLVDGRYVESTESGWRILEMPLHGRSHTMYSLPVHLQLQYNVCVAISNTS